MRGRLLVRNAAADREGYNRTLSGSIQRSGETCGANELSGRLLAIVDALPLRPGIRVLEIGCGPGAAARVIARRIGHGHVLAIDRSAKAIAQATSASEAEIAAGLLSLRHVAAEELELQPGEAPYDIAFAVRVGTLDGRHPEAGRRAMRRIAAALTPSGRLFIHGGNPLRELSLRNLTAALRPGTVTPQ